MQDLIRSSPDRVRWLHELAVRRLTKEAADIDLRILTVAQAAYGSIHSKKNMASFEKLKNGLRAVINAVPVEKQDKKANRQRVAGSLMKLGATLRRN